MPCKRRSSPEAAQPQPRRREYSYRYSYEYAGGMSRPCAGWWRATVCNDVSSACTGKFQPPSSAMSSPVEDLFHLEGKVVVVTGGSRASPNPSLPHPTVSSALALAPEPPRTHKPSAPGCGRRGHGQRDVQGLRSRSAALQPARGEAEAHSRQSRQTRSH